MLNEDTIMSDAVKAVNYNAKRKNAGGFHLKHEPSSIGMAIKWILGIKRMSFSRFAKLFNGTTPQNANHWINRTKITAFSEGDILQICKILKVNKEYLEELCSKIDEIREANTSGVA